ncbi:MAG: MaoC family dehydratase [Myxococcota bacterium]
MPVPTRYFLHQGPVIGALVRAATASKEQGAAKAPPELPGPEQRKVIPPRPKDLVRDYVRHVGGEPSAYRNEVPPHLFPQWVFPLVTDSFRGLPYPMQKAMNGGCRIEVRAPLPGDEPLHVTGRLDSIDDDGRRAVLQHRSVTGTSTHPEALVAYFQAIVPLGGGKGDGKGKKKEKPRVPDDARELARWKIGAKAGFDFAKLTGDINPIHWVAPYAKAFGFPNVILHGFSTMARAMEGLNRALFAGDVHAIRMLDVRFTRPLVLPAKVGLYVRGNTEVYVGDAPGGPAYLRGTFEAPGHGG